MTTIRLTLSLSLHFGWVIQQLDVKNAFLHGLLSKTIFMTQPPGFISTQHPKHVCKLNKALYGLCQAPRSWYSRFSSFLLAQGFKLCHTNDSLFVRHHSNSIKILLIYVDDILVTGNDLNLIQNLQLCIEILI